MSGRDKGGTLVISGASGGGQPPNRRPDKNTGHYAPDVGPFQPLTGIKMAKPEPTRRMPPVQAPDPQLPQVRPRSQSAPTLLQPPPFVAALDGRSESGAVVANVRDRGTRRQLESMMNITDRGAQGGARRMGASPRSDAQGNILGVTPNSMSGVSPNAPTHLYGHGGFAGNGIENPQPVFGNQSPSQLAQTLVRGGLPQNYRGVMYANGCNTGRLGPLSFAFELSRSLGAQQRFPTIRANRGNAHHFQDGTTGVLPPSREEDHAEQSGAVAQQTVDLTMESLRANPQRQQQIQQQLRQLTQQSQRIEHEFYQRDPSVFVEFPPMRPMQGRRQSFSGDIQSLLQPMPAPRRRNSISSQQEVQGLAAPQAPPVQALFANQGVMPSGRPRSKSVGDQGGLQVPKPKE